MKQVHCLSWCLYAVSCTNGDVRLVGGSNSTCGHVEVCANNNGVQYVIIIGIMMMLKLSVECCIILVLVSNIHSICYVIVFITLL